MELESNPRAADSEQAYLSAPILRTEHAEGWFTRLVEQQSAKVSSTVFLFAAISAMSASLLLELTRHRTASRFIGMWPGPLLTMGVYNKLVKTFGAR